MEGGTPSPRVPSQPPGALGASQAGGVQPSFDAVEVAPGQGSALTPERDCCPSHFRLLSIDTERYTGRHCRHTASLSDGRALPASMSFATQQHPRRSRLTDQNADTAALDHTCRTAPPLLTHYGADEQRLSLAGKPTEWWRCAVHAARWRGCELGKVSGDRAHPRQRGSGPTARRAHPLRLAVTGGTLRKHKPTNDFSHPKDSVGCLQLPHGSHTIR